MPRSSKLDIIANTKNLNVKVSEEAHRRLKVYAAIHCTDMNTVMDKLILKYIPEVKEN